LHEPRLWKRSRPNEAPALNGWVPNPLSIILDSGRHQAASSRVASFLDFVPLKSEESLMV